MRSTLIMKSMAALPESSAADSLGTGSILNDFNPDTDSSEFCDKNQLRLPRPLAQQHTKASAAALSSNRLRSDCDRSRRKSEVIARTDSEPPRPEVLLWAVTTPSGIFQPEFVVHCLAESLLAAEITFGSLNRCVSKQKLNLFKSPPREVA